MNSSRPVEIVGGGLAGLALGVGLRRAGVAVTVFEAGDYPRHRVCGEFITGLPPTTAARLGIESVFEGSLRHEDVAWFIGSRPSCKMRLPSAAIGISRFLLDARLANLFVACGGTLVPCHRVTGEVKGVGRVRTEGRRRHADSPWVGLKVHVRNLSLAAALEFHLGDGAYVGLSPVEEGWINVCGLFKRRSGLKGDTPDALAQTLRGCGLTVLAGRLNTAEFRHGSACAVAGFCFDRAIQRRPGVALGDACAVVPPFTGNGMAMAFTGAALALDPVVDWALHGASWEDASQRIQVALQREFRTRLMGTALLHPLLLGRGGRACLGLLARAGMIPLRPFYYLLH
jgi:flavin-dependent dehydrogenase